MRPVSRVVNTQGSATPKWVFVIGALVVLLLAWRLLGSRGRAGRYVEVGIVCTACQFQGTTKVDVANVAWPVVCPKCKERKAYLARQCPKCHKQVPTDPKAPPTACPHCKASLGGEQTAP